MMGDGVVCVVVLGLIGSSKAMLVREENWSPNVSYGLLSCHYSDHYTQV